MGHYASAHTLRRLQPALAPEDSVGSPALGLTSVYPILRDVSVFLKDRFQPRGRPSAHVIQSKNKSDSPPGKKTGFAFSLCWYFCSTPPMWEERVLSVSVGHLRGPGLRACPHPWGALTTKKTQQACRHLQGSETAPRPTRTGLLPSRSTCLEQPKRTGGPSDATSATGSPARGVCTGPVPTVGPWGLQLSCEPGFGQRHRLRGPDPALSYLQGYPSHLYPVLPPSGVFPMLPDNSVKEVGPVCDR